MSLIPFSISDSLLLVFSIHSPILHNNTIFMLQLLRTFLMHIHIRNDMLYVFPVIDTLSIHYAYLIIFIHGYVFILNQ